MDKATGFRAFMIVVAAIVLFTLIALYQGSKSGNKASSSSERFNTSLQPPSLSTLNTPSQQILLPQGPPRVEIAHGSYGPETYADAAPAMASNTADSQPVAAATVSASQGDASSVFPSEPMDNEQYRAIDFGSRNVEAPFTGARLTSSDLLPKDAVNTKWAQVTPSGQGELRDLNFMSAGWHIGINTQGQSLRNANLQLRSDPVNPQYKVSPWNMSTVEPDVSRRPFEII